eukprot:6093701-Alexandrium_andersonii.AAC.1
MCAQAFAREHKKGTPECEAYNQSRRYADKQQFRMRWAQARLAELVRRKTHSESYAKIDSSLGTYLPWQVIIKEEGGAEDREAIRAGLAYVKRCKDS